MLLSLLMLSATAAPEEPPPMARFRQLPSAFDGALAFPEQASGKRGEALLRCRVRSDGVPITCTVYSETPEGLGFGKAAMKLRSKIRLHPPAGDASPWVLVPFRWDGTRTFHIY